MSQKKKKVYKPKSSKEYFPLKMGKALKTFVRRLRERLFESLEEGNKHMCPVCTGKCVIYKRRISATMARQLRVLYRASGTAFMTNTGWVNVQDLYHPGASGDYGKMKFWGLIESGKIAGVVAKGKAFWRITEHGKAFVRGDLTVPQFAYVYKDEHYYIDGECMEGPQVTFKYCLTAKYDTKELWNAPLGKKT